MHTKTTDETLPPRDFGWAIRALKAGHRVRRAGWNGKGMWIALTQGPHLHRHPTSAGDPTGWTGRLNGAAAALQTAESPDEIRIGDHIDMRAADGSLVIGWLASQTDMLSEDWELVI
jgi:hypothetical protein